MIKIKITQLKKNVSNSVCYFTDHRFVGNSVLNSINVSVYNSVIDSTGNPVWYSVNHPLRHPVWNSIRSSFEESDET